MSEANLIGARAILAMGKQQIFEAPVQRSFDSLKYIHVMGFANNWVLSSTLLQMYDGTLQPVRFGGCVWK